jgi:hypothetical protein
MVLTLAILWRRIDWLKMSGAMLGTALLLISGAFGALLRAVLSKARAPVPHPSTMAWVALLSAIAVLSARAFLWHGQRVVAAGNWWGSSAPPCQPFAEWARQNTPRTAVFLIPIGPDEGWQDFRHLSQRNVFVHWKDGTAWPYAPWYAEDWLERMRLLGLMEVAHLHESDYRTGRWIQVREIYANQVYRQVNEPLVRSLAKQFRIDYWVTYQDTPTQLPVVYQMGEWKVVKLPQANGALTK